MAVIEKVQTQTKKHPDDLIDVYNELAREVGCHIPNPNGIVDPTGIPRSIHLRLKPGNNKVPRWKIKLACANPVFQKNFERNPSLDAKGRPTHTINLVLGKFDEYQVEEEATLEQEIVTARKSEVAASGDL